MSRTMKQKKPPGYEYWSRRPSPLRVPGKVAKRMTHRRERIQSKTTISKLKEDAA